MNRSEVIVTVPRRGRQVRRRRKRKGGAGTATQKRERTPPPAVITVAENADLHRERQPAIKVHGFHGESRYLFLSSLRTALFSLHASSLPFPRVVRSVALLSIPNTESARVLRSSLRSMPRRINWPRSHDLSLPLTFALTRRDNFVNKLSHFLLSRFYNSVKIVVNIKLQEIDQS